MPVRRCGEELILKFMHGVFKCNPCFLASIAMQPIKTNHRSLVNEPSLVNLTFVCFMIDVVKITAQSLVGILRDIDEELPELYDSGWADPMALRYQVHQSRSSSFLRTMIESYRLLTWWKRSTMSTNSEFDIRLSTTEWSMQACSCTVIGLESSISLTVIDVWMYLLDINDN